jgi:hypothetical protein
MALPAHRSKSQQPSLDGAQRKENQIRKYKTTSPGDQAGKQPDLADKAIQNIEMKLLPRNRERKTDKMTLTKTKLRNAKVVRRYQQVLWRTTGRTACDEYGRASR